MKFSYILILCCLNIINLNSQVPVFGEPQDLGIADANYLNEASGLSSSSKNKNIFWSHNDDGNDTRLYAINSKARIVGIYYLNIKNGRDFEDIAVGFGPESGKYYIYLGDIGDNDTKYDKKHIYRFIEPDVAEDQKMTTDTISIIDDITFKYPDDKIYDSETLMLDPLTKDIYLVTKRLKNEKVFRLTYPYSSSKTITAEQITKLPFGFEGFNGSGATGGDISTNGLEILIKTYSRVYYFSRNQSESIKDALERDPQEVNYNSEPQGESITWDPKSKGYYTLSEMSPMSIPAHLYYYQKTGLQVKKKKTVKHKKSKH